MLQSWTKLPRRWIYTILFVHHISTLYCISLKYVKAESVVKSQERREDHNMRQPVVHKKFVIQTSHNRSENSISDQFNACPHGLRDVWQAIVLKTVHDWSLAYMQTLSAYGCYSNPGFADGRDTCIGAGRCPEWALREVLETLRLVDY